MSSLSTFSSHALSSFHGCPCCGSDRTRSVPAILHNEVHISQTQRHALKVGHYGYGNGISYGSNSVQHTTTTPLVAALTPPPKPNLPEAPAQPTQRPLPNKPQPPKAQGRATNALAIIVLIIGVLALPVVLLVSLFIPFFFLLYGLGLSTIILVLFLAANQANYTPEAKQRQQEYLQALQRWEQLYPSRLASAQSQLQLDLQQWQGQMAAWQARCASIEMRWNNAMHTWEALFYCDRCDSVFLPATGEYAALSMAKRLLWKLRSDPAA